MTKVLRGLALALVCLGGAASVPAAEQAPAPAPDADAARATATLERMASALTGAQRLTVVVEAAYDVIQSDGRKLEFGETRKIALRRPDRIRVDVQQRDGSARGLLFDGTTISVFDLDENVYASVQRKGTVDAALDYLVNELDMRMPLSELFGEDLPATLARATGVRFIDEEKIGGVPCEHLASRGPEADYQLWVATGDRPLPQRLVITYKQAEGMPQFAATFSRWDLAPDLPDPLFAFTPSEGAEQIRVKPAAEGGKR